MNAISPQTLAQFCDAYLHIDEFDDYCPNGLQVDADQAITHIVTGVTACQALIDEAIKMNAQAILVHHGYFWKGEPSALVGMKGKRIRTLIKHGISLLAYHLPLDAHPVIGNNAQLAKLLNLTITEPLYPHQKHPVGNIATCSPIAGDKLAATLAQALGRQPLHIIGTDKQISKVGLCTGGAQDMIEQAAKMGCDAFISGEISERTTHSARELGLDYFAAGHHATERDGVRELGRVVSEHFGIKVSFVDIDNPA